MAIRPITCVYFVLTLLTVAASAPRSAQAQFSDWNTRYGTWSDVSNWNPNVLPGIGQIVRIGNLPAAYTADVELDINTAVGGLQIYNGMVLETSDHDLQVVFDTLITGSNGRSSELWVQNSTFGTRDLINEGRLRLTSGTINVSRLLDIDTNSIMFGGGTINLTRDSGIAMRNDGTIFTNGQPFLTFNQLGSGLIDLDGSTGNGFLSVKAGGGPATVTLNGTQLADSFSGRIDLRSGNVLNMNLSNGWTADSLSQINLFGDSGAANPSRIQGGDWNLNGSLNVFTDDFYGEGSGSVEADTIIGNTAGVFIESGNSLEFAGNVTVNGGNYLLEEDAGLSFEANTVLSGGTFNTHSDLGSDGLVSFNGLTAWNGDVSINGIARQNGNAIVAAPTTIDAGILDMDGGGSTNWSIGNALVINANGVDSTISNSFDGTMSIAGGLSSLLTVNLDQPGEHWTMAGEMNVSNPFNVGVNRIAGSQMRLTGDLNVTGLIGVQADLVVANPGTVSFANADTVLFTSGTTLVEQNATFIGEGTLVNMSAGKMTLADGVTLDDVGLENYGELHIGSSPGIVDVASFENFDSGIVQIEIGGYGLGDEFDFLMVSQGDAMLDGLLEVELIDVGNGLFAPVVGDEFTILAALDGVFGTFDSSPVSFAAGNSYHWDVLYNSHDVTLHLASISSVPEPNTIAIVVFTALAFACRRRHRRLPKNH